MTEQHLFQTICTNTDRLNKGEITVNEANAQLSCYRNEIRKTEDFNTKFNAFIRKRG